MNNIRYSRYPKGARDLNLSATVVDKHQVKDNLEGDDFYFKQLNSIRLNKAQKEAVKHYKGPLLTLAGAGSGKTSVLVCRTGYLIQVHHVNPKNILLMTFTKKAAEEMRTRLQSLPGITEQIARIVQTNTFHAFFLTLLRSKGYNQKILSNDRFRQIIIKGILKEIGMTDRYEPETLLDLFSIWKMNMVDVKDKDFRKTVSEEILTVFQKYENWKESNDQMDFDDILVFSYDLLLDSNSLLTSLQNRFQFIMVDEFQDTNLLQYELIKMIASSHRNLMVVGDDDQTIYSFNGARNDLILNFHNQFPDATEVILDINYRSHSAIVGLGNEIIKHNKLRKEKTLTSIRTAIHQPLYMRPSTVDEEAKWIVDDIKKKVMNGQYHYSEIAILYRAESNSRAAVEEMMIHDLPFIHYSQNNQTFYEQWVVKPVIDHLRLVINPKNFEAIEGIISTLYIKKETGFGFITLNNQLEPKKYPLIHLTKLPSIKQFQADKVHERLKLLKKLSTMPPSQAIKKIRKDFYDKYIQGDEGGAITLGKETMKEILDELEASAKRFETIAEFLTFIDEMKKKQQEAQNGFHNKKNHIHLMTIHKSKGLEFPVVYLIGASEGILPHVTALEAAKMEKATRQEKLRYINQALEEERRITYVAITRAMEELYISSPAYYRGKEVNVSQFLLEAFGSKEKQELKKQKVKETEKIATNLLAWMCTTNNCNGWQRINNDQENEQSEKNCPLCKGTMKKGEKTILV